MSTAVIHTRLEKAARDHGFDLVLPRTGNWLSFASSHRSLKLWLAAFNPIQFSAAFSDSKLRGPLTSLAPSLELDLPKGASFAILVSDINLLYPLLRRGIQLFHSLPSEPLHEFENKARGLPKSTEAERLVIQRVGQNIFRECLIDYWDGKCAVTGLAILELLKASHIKPWNDCDSDAERLDVFNGLLLAPNLDAAFDRGFITFKDDGSIVTTTLESLALSQLGIKSTFKVNNLNNEHRRYLKWHREKIYRDLL